MITFTIKPTSIRTKTLDGLTGVVKLVEWILEGELSGQKFSLPQTTTLQDPEPASFIPLNQITEQQVVQWIENTVDLQPIKAHIELVLNKEAAKADLTQENLPWAPPVPEPTTPTTPTETPVTTPPINSAPSPTA